MDLKGAQWLSGRVLDSRLRVQASPASLRPSLVLVQPRKTRPFITERLLMGCKESNQTKNNNKRMGLKAVHMYLYFSI